MQLAPALEQNLGHIVVRRARPGDAAALHRLAELDGASPHADRLAALAGSGGSEPVLVAESIGTTIAAIDVARDLLVADPFRPTAAAGKLLRARAGRLREEQEAAGPRRGIRAAVRGRLRPRTG